MKKIFYSILCFSLFISCKKSGSTDTGNTKNSPAAGSTWRYKITTYNGSSADSFYMNWKARDTTISGEKWLAIDKQVGTGPFTPLFAMSPNNGARTVLKLTSSGSNGLWLPANVNQGQTFLMHSPIGADYGFTNTPNGKTMQIISINYLLDLDGVSQGSLIYAGVSETTSSGTLSETIYYRSSGEIMIMHVLDQYTTATDTHNKIVWKLVSFQP